MSVKLNKSNQLHNKGGFAYYKLYNLNKDIFTYLIKEYGPFNNIYFKALSLSKSYIKQWFTANHYSKVININKKNPSISTLHTKAQLIKIYRVLKIKIIKALNSTKYKQMNFRVQQKYYINLLLFHQLNLNIDTTIYSLQQILLTSPL